MFFDMEKYVYSESVFNTLYMEINTNVNGININGTKMTSFFFCELQLNPVLLLNCDSYTS